MHSNLLVAAGAVCVLTGLVHSLFGEQRLIRPQLANRAGVMARPLARQVTRFAWHWATVLWFLVALALILAGLGEPTSRLLLWSIAGAHLVAGLGDAILTRGRHIGWPLITLVGVLTLLDLISNR